MKKYVLTIITCAAALPLFSFNFNEDNLVINADIKAGINAEIVQEINANIKENKEIKITDNNIVSAIKEEMQAALKEIKRNCNLRKNIFTRGFVEEQKIQKERYDEMLKSGVPYQIFNYIKAHFDLNRMDKIQVVCIHHDETIIEVRFTFPGKYAVVYYDYNYKNRRGQTSPLRHIIS